MLKLIDGEGGRGEKGDQEGNIETARGRHERCCGLRQKTNTFYIFSQSSITWEIDGQNVIAHRNTYPFPYICYDHGTEVKTVAVSDYLAPRIDFRIGLGLSLIHI